MKSLARPSSLVATMSVATILATFVVVSPKRLKAMPAPPQPTLVGVWYLTSRDCTSAAPVRDGFVVGKDTFQLTLTSEGAAEEKKVLASCEMDRTGSYSMTQRKISTTFHQQQTCKDPAPVPSTDSELTFLAFLDDNESVTVTTGDLAAAVFPPGDALVKHFSKVVVRARPLSRDEK